MLYGRIDAIPRGRSLAHRFRVADPAAEPHEVNPSSAERQEPA
jgi:hypothetical protein